MTTDAGKAPIGEPIGGAADGASKPGEPWALRIDRNLIELLQELRVAQAGIQILFAFLLTLAFTQRFEQLSQPQRVWYVVTLMLCTASTALLIAPASFHRLLFRRGMRTELVQVSNILAVAGLAFLLAATVSALGLIIDFAVGWVPGVVLSVIALLWFVLFWYLLPLALYRRNRHGRARSYPSRQPRVGRTGYRAPLDW